MRRKLAQFCTFLLLAAWAVPVFAGKILAEVEYFYADDGTLTGRALNGKRVNFEYDLRGQLLAVKDAQGRDLERYTYDPAGNRLSKTVGGVTTTYVYDEANQLVSSSVGGKTTSYKYDAAGRLVQAGDKTYLYDGRNKVTGVRQNGNTIAKFEYNIDGQISKAVYGDKVEEFLWDGLALVWRSGVTYVNEPYVTGGNPVLAGDDVLFNDMLGSTLNIGGKSVRMTAFGESEDANAMYTGKPYIGELGYAFLFRAYDPAQGKWTTSDPLGYPDGWNNFVYCQNDIINKYDFLGGWTASGHKEFFDAYDFFQMYDRMSLNSQYLTLLISANLAVDNDQSEASSYKHAMKSRTQSCEDAIKAINDFISQNLIAARQAVIDYENKKISLTTACNQLITFLGIASHTVQDRMCPEHFEGGQPKTWYAGWFFYLNVQHLPELFRSPSVSNINSFNDWMRSEIVTIIGGNKNIIRELFE